jgi:uncharacterized membrane protein (DUF4010 family)
MEVVMSEALVRRLLWEVRILRILVIALAIGGAGVIAQDLPLNDSPIVTRELTVARGEKGEMLRLSADRRATLELRDAEGRLRVRLGMGPKGPSMLIYDERGRATEFFGPNFGVRPLTND